MDTGPVRRAGAAAGTRQHEPGAGQTRERGPLPASPDARAVAPLRAPFGMGEETAHAPPRGAQPPGASGSPRSSAVVHLGAHATGSADPRAPADYTHLKAVPPATRSDAAAARPAAADVAHRPDLLTDLAREPGSEARRVTAAAAGGARDHAGEPSVLFVGASAASLSRVGPATEPHAPVTAPAHRLPERAAELVVRGDAAPLAPARPRSVAIAVLVLLLLLYAW